MRLFALILIGVVVLQSHQNALVKKALQHDVDGLQAEVQSARIFNSAKERTANDAGAEAVATKEALANAYQEIATLKQRLASRDKWLEEHVKLGEEGEAIVKKLNGNIKEIQKQRDDAIAESKRLAGELAKAKKELTSIEPGSIAARIKELEERTKDDPELLKQWDDLIERTKKIGAKPVEPRKPIEPPQPPPAKPKPERPYSNDKLSDAILKARDEGKEVVIVFRQTVCNPCDQFERDVLNTPYFKERADGRYEVVTINIDDDPKTGDLFHVRRTPDVAVYSPNSSNSDATIRKRLNPSKLGARFDPDTFLFEIQKPLFRK